MQLPEQVAREARDAVEVLYRLSPYPFDYPAWRDYHTRFLARYGTGAVAPVLDLVADSGLGLPAEYLRSPWGRALRAVTEREEQILTLIQNATMGGDDEIVLTDEAIERLSASRPMGASLPSRVEIAVEVGAASLEALNHGRFVLRVTGTPRPGRTTVTVRGGHRPRPAPGVVVTQIRRQAADIGGFSETALLFVHGHRVSSSSVLVDSKGHAVAVSRHDAMRSEQVKLIHQLRGRTPFSKTHSRRGRDHVTTCEAATHTCFFPVQMPTSSATGRSVVQEVRPLTGRTRPNDKPEPIMTNRAIWPIWVGTIWAFLVQILPMLAPVGLLVLVSSPDNPLWVAVLISAVWFGGGGVAAWYWTRLAKPLALKWPRPGWPLNPDLGERPGREFPRLHLDWPEPGSRGRKFYEKVQKWANIWQFTWIFVWNWGFVGTLLVLLTYLPQ